MAYNTGNPLGSTDPRDFSDNSENLDRALNSDSQTWTNRLGQTRPTLRAGEIASQEVVDTADQAKQNINDQVEGLRGEVDDRLNNILIAGGRIFDSEAQGRAAVDNGQYYYAASSDPNVSKTLWRRISSTSSKKIADDPDSKRVEEAFTDISVYFDDEIVYDSIAQTLSFPSGTAMKAYGIPGLIRFDAITLEAPGAIPGGAISGAAYYYYLDYNETELSPIKFKRGSGVDQPLQDGSIRKLGTLYQGNWSNSEFAFRAVSQSRNFKRFLKNVIPGANDDPRLQSDLISLYGDVRPTSTDNAPLVAAPSDLRALGIFQAVHIDPNDQLVGNFLVYPISWKSDQRPNIFMAITVHSSTGEWSFGNYPGPFYYLSATNKEGQTYTVESGALEVVKEIDEKNRVYGASIIPQVELPEVTDLSQLTLGMRSDSGIEYFFGGWWTSISAGIEKLFKLTTLLETFWPRWEYVDSAYLPKPKPLPDTPPSGLKALVDAMNNPAHSLRLHLIGDSITWGSGASGLSPSSPRSQSLSDPRNNLESRTWTNLLRDYLGAWGCGVLRARTDLGDGASVDAYEYSMPPINSQTRYIYPKTRRGITPIKDERYVDQTPHGYVLDIRQSEPIIPGYNYNAEVTTRLVGDNISYTYAQLNGDPAIDMAEVLVDGAVVGEFSFGGDSAFFGARSPVFEFPFGEHEIILRRKSSAKIQIRLEAINVIKKVVVVNDGIIGSNTTRWVPDGPLLNDSTSSADEVVMIQLGTNNRTQSSSNSPKIFRAQLVEITQWLLDRGKKVVLLASCVATIENETGDTRYLHMNEISSIIKSVAEELGVDFIDQYSYTLQHLLDGEDVLSDGLHPNDAGHRIMFDNIKQRLIGVNQ
ncbi:MULTISPECIES: SGNH/GDSL hydrolase family protein [unclassified Halomonas]|uniref:SGNH/GDSL hydrolase family protein n=1 Tax=unclassified Halomonas TaxID=2609666 RepID=UPI002076B82B|nr:MULTISPECIES: SGNH/GDSL hydrolase family protein [unclassified Halomonas]